MKTREPLRSRAFRIGLVSLVAAACLGVAVAWRASRNADAALELALDRAQSSHALELQLERLHSAVVVADAAAETFLLTWRSTSLVAATTAETEIRVQFDALRESLAGDRETGALIRQIDDSLDERRANFTRLAEWARAGQLNRVREWAEAHRDALHATQLSGQLAQLREHEHAVRERDRSALAAARANSARAARLSWLVQVALCGLVVWLLWQYHRTRRLVTMCAWTRTIQYEGEWLTFEDYLRRRFGLETTHGIRPDQADKVLAEDDPPGPAA
jgi:CHASE3 domain sensor protein